MFTVVICGRPNVGKSTLFNRLSETKKSITYPIAGTTRDTQDVECFWQNKNFILIDTGGIEIKTKETLNKEIQQQINIAMARSDLILFLTDGKEGPHQNDFLIASKIKKLKKPVLLAVNKIDSKSQEELIFPFYKLGAGEPIPVSAQTGAGCGDLLDKIVFFVKERVESEEKTKKPIKIGIFGRQNVGKSSLLNNLLGKTKTIVSEIPGTTRDAIDTLISYQDQKIILIDTAGIKRKRKIELGIEKFSMKKSLGMIEKCNIALLVLDAIEGITRQDLRIGGQILKNKKGLIILINKWDIIEKEVKDKKKEIEKTTDIFQNRLSGISWAPIIFTSAKFGKNTKGILSLVLMVNQERNKLLTFKDQKDFFEEVVKKSPLLKSKSKKPPKIKEFIQKDIRPPKFVLTIGKKDILPAFYFHFLEKELRKKFGFFGTPIEITTRTNN